MTIKNVRKIIYKSFIVGKSNAQLHFLNDLIKRNNKKNRILNRGLTIFGDKNEAKKIFNTKNKINANK